MYYLEIQCIPKAYQLNVLSSKPNHTYICFRDELNIAKLTPTKQNHLRSSNFGQIYRLHLISVAKILLNFRDLENSSFVNGMDEFILHGLNVILIISLQKSKQR